MPSLRLRDGSRRSARSISMSLDTFTLSNESGAKEVQKNREKNLSFWVHLLYLDLDNTFYRRSVADSNPNFFIGTFSQLKTGMNVEYHINKLIVSVFNIYVPHFNTCC